MMNRKDAPSADPSRDAQAVVDPVLAEFSLDNTQCMIVVEDGDTDGDVADRRLGCLDIAGRRYAVYARTPAPKPQRRHDPQPDPLASLTVRELQIVRLVCVGCVNKQIAHKLNISEYTVKTYLKQIFCKLNVHSRSAMVFRCASWAMAESAQAVAQT